MEIKARVKSSSGKSEIVEKDGDFLVYVKSAPEKGRANLEVIKLFSKKFKKNVEIIKGMKSKNKVLRVT